jgi:hypothetical protein
MEESVMSDYGDEQNEARQRKKQLRPVILNEQETEQENKKQVKLKDGNGSKRSHKAISGTHDVEDCWCMYGSLRSEIADILQEYHGTAGGTSEILELIDSRLEEKVKRYWIGGSPNTCVDAIPIQEVKSTLKGDT